MTLENIFALIGICLTVVSGLATVAFALARSYLADHEARLRKVEAMTAECVRRSDLDEMRKEFRGDIERLSQQLTELFAEPRATPRRRRA